MTTTSTQTQLPPKQLALGCVAACAAIGDMERLSAALVRALDAGLAVEEAKEVLVQLYAYAGFPRALNALAGLMKVLEGRRAQGIEDVQGRLAGPVPDGRELLAKGTANQTKLSGAPVKGPLLDFAPAVDRFLKSHLFGDIFERDNLDWASRELATISALSALAGVEPQLAAHLRIGTNVGLRPEQLMQLAQELSDHAMQDAAQRLQTALDKHVHAASAQ